jgi:hypothetical protein
LKIYSPVIAFRSESAKKRANLREEVPAKFLPPSAAEDLQMIDLRMTHKNLRGDFINKPVYAGIRHGKAQGVQGGQDVRHIANGSHPHNQNLLRG